MSYEPRYRDPRRNEEGYLDLTHFEGVRNAERSWKEEDRERREEARFTKLLNTIFYITDLAGFKIKNRIVFEDKKTGKVWR